MTLLALGDRAATGALLGLAIFGGVAMAGLQLGYPVPAIALPGALVAGMCWPARAAAKPVGAKAPAWVAAGIAVPILAVAAMVAFGAVATPSRHWDGAVAWDVKSHYLARGLTLEQPFFADPNVLVHTRDYPLLQPMVVAAGDLLLGPDLGRLLFPCLFGVLALLVGVGLRRAGASGTVAWLGAAGCVLAPRLANPTSGGADSGYAELFLLVATTALALGILVRDPRLLAAGAAIAVMVKPEGMVYAGLAVVVCWCAGDRRRTVPVTLGWLFGALAWLPVQRQLQTLAGGGVATTWMLCGGVALVVIVADTVARRWRATVHGRTLAVVSLFAVSIVLLPWIAGSLGSGEAGSMAAYFADPGRALDRLGRVPAILLGALSYSMPPGSFALAFAAPVVAAVAVVHAGGRPAAPAVVAFVAAGICAVFGAFLFSPEEDLDHHLRSSMSRLLLHWLGPVMLLAGVWSQAAWTPSSPPRFDAEGAGDR